MYNYKIVSIENKYLTSDETVFMVSFGSGLAMVAIHFNLPEGVEKWS